MKARIRFVNYPFFNRPPDSLVCAGTLVGRGEARHMWTMIFTVSRQISALVYEGDLRWESGPSEQDFGKGVRFKLIVNTRGRTEGKEKLEVPKDDRPDKEKKNDKKAGKDVDKAKKAKAQAQAQDKPDDQPKPDDKPKPDKPKKLAHLPDDAYVRVPVQGVLAEGELLG